MCSKEENKRGKFFFNNIFLIINDFQRGLFVYCIKWKLHSTINGKTVELGFYMETSFLSFLSKYLKQIISMPKSFIQPTIFFTLLKSVFDSVEYLDLGCGFIVKAGNDPSVCCHNSSIGIVEDPDPQPRENCFSFVKDGYRLHKSDITFFHSIGVAKFYFM